MNRFLLSLFIALLFFASTAEAAFISSVFEPTATDVSVNELLKPLWGSLVDEAMGSGGSSGATALTNIVKFLLTNIIVPIGGMLLLYSSYAGLSASAMNGEIFGDKKTAYWVAVRTIIGFGMITPAPALKGLALVNIFLMYLTLNGVGAASSLWNVVVDEVTKNPVILTSSSPDTKVFDGMLRGEMCAAIYNNAVTDAGEREVPADQLKEATKLTDDNDELVIGWTKAVSQSDGGCGKIISNKTADLETIAALAPLDSIQSTSTASAKVQSEMQAQTAGTLNALEARAHEVAGMIIASRNVLGQDEPQIESYYNLMQWFKAQQQTAAKNIATTAMSDVKGALKAAAKREGWVTAGFYFLALGNFQQAVNRSIAMDWVTAESIDEAKMISIIADETYHGKVRGQWRSMEAYIDAGHKQMKAGKILPAKIKDFTSSPGTSALQATGKLINDQVIASVQSNATPLAAAADIGSTFINIGWGAMMGGGIANRAAAIVPAWLGSYKDKAEEWGGKIAFFGFCVWAVGVALSLVCLLPALMWLKRVGSWIIRVTVAQIGGPAWMVMHVHHAGDGMTGNAGGGYMLALSLVFVPVLDITALAIVYELMVTLPHFVNGTIMSSILGMGNGSAALLSVFITAIVDAGLVMTLLGLFERIEHEVMAFVGGRGSDLNLDQDGDKNRMFALMTYASRKMPGMPKFGGKNDDNKGGADISGGGGKGSNWEDLKTTPKIPTSKLLPKDR